MNLLGIGAAAFGVGILLAGNRTTETWKKITNFDGIKSFSS